MYQMLRSIDMIGPKLFTGGAKEKVPHNIPESKGKPVKLITYADSNLMHNILDGKAGTGILHFFNQTPFDWYSKKQATPEVATFSTEELAARTAERFSVIFAIVLELLPYYSQLIVAYFEKEDSSKGIGLCDSVYNNYRGR